ncbi:sulfite exporter TauE/SafE family protein [Marimonas arenosa]|uniref:Probable membrane transporter protein n=1 Tax=Marimonas arenosa TaxID=1795305 RepID=A0AAE4B6J8_9RHOB|nr:sulfite exporter TauE/SafE family protein [Marimonas arenosa]MDQ2090501.1 sulfite exporter TauE/SafE family protein [Marimonas arenosa]
MIVAAALTPGQLAFAAVTVFFAGLVRGFTGFALSALIMATLVILIPPVELIPICLLLELASSLLLLRGGLGDADRKMALRLQTGALIGVPLGLWLTTSLPPDLSRRIALLLILGLAAAQLLRLRLPVSPAALPTVATGIFSGFVTGLASIGGMVIALYTLALNIPPRRIRGTLILIIFLGGTLGLVWQSLFGMLTATALTRATLLFLPTMAGVALGRRLFTPRWERYHRPFSLSLLIALALASLVRSLA